ncbi:MAG: hypothetical protein LBH05_04470 [Deferribacteraceae bacterium]|jgi:DNA-binding FadR family transcriptional regulator|nr:hypothetical protein [Deferribacteraceae bacterium]
MRKREKAAAKATDDFTNALLQALENQSGKKGKPNTFFASPVWFFLALFAIIVNVIMAALIFWQRMRIDYLITKIIGEYS